MYIKLYTLLNGPRTEYWVNDTCCGDHGDTGITGTGSMIHLNGSFIAETKGSLSSMGLTPIEQTKIDCAKKLFNSLAAAKVRYHQVTAYQDLIDAMNGTDLTP